MKNGIIVIVVAGAAAIAGVVLSSTEPEQDQIVIGPGGVVNTDRLAETVTARRKSEAEELEKARPVPSQEGPWPKAFVEETTYEFGKMQVGAELEHVFVIRNDGDGPMNLLEGKSTCKCTGFTLSTKHLERGEEAELTVRWIGKFRDENFSHGGPVYTDDPDRPQIDFSVAGKVDNAVELLPTDVWSVGRVGAGEAGVMEAHIISNLYDTIALESVEVQSPHVTVDVAPMSQKELEALPNDAVSGYTVTVELSPEVPAGLFDSRIDFKIDRLDKKTSVNVTATKAGPIEIQQSPGVLWIPSANGLKMGQFAATKGRDAELVLVVNEEQLDGDLELGEITATPSYITAELKPERKVSDSVGRYLLRITVPPGIPRGSFNRARPAKLVLQTNNISFKAF